MKIDNWYKRDQFIENALNSNDIDHNYKKMFMKYIREAIDEKLERTKQELEL